MSGTQGPALDLAVALASVTRRVEVFAFSTALTSLTLHARRAGSGRPVKVSLNRNTWGGGTSIGASLRAFLQRHGERHVTRETLVLIVSDGLDVGEPEVLRNAMREIPPPRGRRHLAQSTPRDAGLRAVLPRHGGSPSLHHHLRQRLRRRKGWPVSPASSGFADSADNF